MFDGILFDNNRTVVIQSSINLVSRLTTTSSCMSLISKGFVAIGLVPVKLRRHMRLFIYVYLSLRMAAIQKQMQVKCKTEIICLLTPSPRRSKWSHNKITSLKTPRI